MILSTPPGRTACALALGLLALGLLGACLGLGAAPAYAQDAHAQESPTHERATSLLREGLALRQQGDDEGALARFEQAFALERSAIAQAQIALAEAALGRWLEAHTHLSEALARRDDAWIQANGETLEGALGTMREHLARLILSEGIEGARVRVNELDRGTLPLAEPLWVEAGSVLVVVEAEGHLPFRRTLQIEAGTTARERVRLLRSGEAEGSGEGGEGSSAPASSGPDLVGPIALYAAGGAAMIAFAVAGGLAAAEVGSCGQGTEDPCTAGQIESARAMALGADVSLGIGGALLVGATIWLAIELALSGGSGEEAPPATQSAALRPWIGPTSAGLSLAGALPELGRAGLDRGAL